MAWWLNWHFAVIMHAYIHMYIYMQINTYLFSYVLSGIMCYIYICWILNVFQSCYWSTMLPIFWKLEMMTYILSHMRPVFLDPFWVSKLEMLSDSCLPPRWELRKDGYLFTTNGCEKVYFRVYLKTTNQFQTFWSQEAPINDQNCQLFACLQWWGRTNTLLHRTWGPNILAPDLGPHCWSFCCANLLFVACIQYCYNMHCLSVFLMKWCVQS